MFPPPLPPSEAVICDRVSHYGLTAGTDEGYQGNHEATTSTGSNCALFGSLLAGLSSSVATYYNGVPVLESSACTAFIVGTTAASATVLDYEGASHILFPFSVRESSVFY